MFDYHTTTNITKNACNLSISKSVASQHINMAIETAVNVSLYMTVTNLTIKVSSKVRREELSVQSTSTPHPKGKGKSIL